MATETKIKNNDNELETMFPHESVAVYEQLKQLMEIFDNQQEIQNTICIQTRLGDIIFVPNSQKETTGHQVKPYKTIF